MITGNVIGGILKVPDTMILVDGETGEEYPAVVTDEEVVLDATVNDLRIGKTAVLAGGVKTGEKEIPSYNTREGFRVIPVGSAVSIHTKNYEFTKLQALICKFNTTLDDSVATIKVSIDGNVYSVNSSDIIATVSVDHDNKTIELGIVNDDNQIQILRYFTYKEIY